MIYIVCLVFKVAAAESAKKTEKRLTIQRLLCCFSPGIQPQRQISRGYYLGLQPDHDLQGLNKGEAGRLATLWSGGLSVLSTEYTTGHLVEGCQLGGGHLPAVLAPLESLEELAGPPQVVGQGQAPLHLQGGLGRGRSRGRGVRRKRYA